MFFQKMHLFRGKRIILVLFGIIFVFANLHAQDHQLIHSNTYSAQGSGYSHLNYLEADSIFVYEIIGTDFTSFPVNYGLWTDEILENTNEVTGRKCVFLDKHWNLLGVFEGGSYDMINSQPINWFAYENGDAKAIFGNSYGATLDSISYPINGTFENLNYNWMKLGYNVINEIVSPELFVKQNFQNGYGQINFIVEGFGYNMHMPLKRAVRLNESESIVIAPFSGEQTIHGTIEQSIMTTDFGYTWFKLHNATNESEMISVSSSDDLLVYHGIHESKVEDRYYGVKTIRGEGVAFDTSGEPYESGNPVNITKSLITFENSDGNALWASELFSYNSLWGDSLESYMYPSLRDGNLVELNSRVFYSQNILFSTSNQNDVLHYTDFFENNQNFFIDETSVAYNFSFGDDEYGILGKSMLYALDSETGSKIATLEISGSQYTWSIFPPSNHEPGVTIYQEPKVFLIGDSLAWVNEFYANNDTVIQFLKKTNGGGTEEFPISLQAGYSTIIAWIDSDLSITGHWIIPVTLGEDPTSRGLRITEMMMLGQDSILVHAYLEQGITTNMDPSGLADVVTYPNYRTSFLGVYAPDFSSGVETVDKSLEFKVFPNPASNLIHIETSANDNLKYALLDISGRLLQSGNWSHSSGNYTIDVSHLNSGVYLLQIASEDKVGVKKVTNNK